MITDPQGLFVLGLLIAGAPLLWAYTRLKQSTDREHRSSVETIDRLMQRIRELEADR